jgi:hypothetical protein
LVILFYLLTRYFPDRRVAVLGTFFTAIDFIFLWSSADGRTEASANALALGAIAAYMYFRERNFSRAILSSQILGAGAVFIHPNAALPVLCLGVMAWRFDRKRFRWRHLFIAGAPYLAFAFLWLGYILESPGDFAAQFLVHAAGHHSERLRTILRPDIAIGKEITRYLTAYYLSDLWAGAMRGWMIFLPLLYVPAIVWLLRRWKRCEQQIQMFLIYTVALMLAMTFLNGFKGDFYLIYIVSLYNGIFAAWLLHLWTRTGPARWTALAVGLAFVALQLSISVRHIQADEFHQDYEPAVRDLARYRAAGKTIIATSALGFGMDFRGFHDDLRLGRYSGLDPDVVVVDRSYRFFDRILAKDEGPVFDYIVTALTTRYRLAARYGSFWIFERVSREPETPANTTTGMGSAMGKLLIESRL